MKMQTSWTQADLAAIEAAIATGARRVRFQTHEVEYQSMADLFKARDAIRDALCKPEAGSNVLFAEYGNGY